MTIPSHKKSPSLRLVAWQGVMTVMLSIVLSSVGLAVDRSWNAAGGSWTTPANWTPAGTPSDGDDVFLGNLPGTQNSIVSLGAIGTVRPELLSISDGMTVRTNSTLIWAGDLVVVEGSNLVDGGAGIATLFRSTLLLDGVLKGNSLLTNFLEVDSGGRVVLADSALAQVFGQMAIDATSSVEGSGSILFNGSSRTFVNNGVVRARKAKALLSASSNSRPADSIWMAAWELDTWWRQRARSFASSPAS